MPNTYRAVFITTLLLLAAQGVLIAVFAFLFYPLSIEAFAPLDEPGTSIRAKIAAVVAIGIVVTASTVRISWVLLRACLREVPARGTLRMALALEAAVLVGSVAVGSSTGMAGAGITLALLVVCHQLDVRHHAHRPAGT
ncbi:hypothetical protein ADL00_00100 [Streptomyces sp. AS58]|uniref:DUF2975 domain-containing protein n=1 Tax=Streptomyces cadmiisoli TaxID=2184053 RepID=A0A2Z4J954_9ACTN|nr:MULTISPECIES: hypothetical protein [Streptomyces]AWW41579.1 hypothetical protein DN051_37020 [Streptomyces cadmiisoli]KOV74769.1 hypothetical protein ADL00_00100 [Streptomyces sp. AS58]